GKAQVSETVFDLKALVQQLCKSFDHKAAAKNIAFNSIFDNNIPEKLFGDSLRLTQILTNLLDNAIKFSNDNDFISIYVELHNNKICDLIIQDTGCGMTIATQTELLKEDFSISKDYNNKNVGTGLGMQLCKSLITKNDGKLSIKSEINIGTKIIISLPFKT
ncbi:MAG: sensor histidine kinase, partial [Candidatus Sericytochromatia bacterium]